MKPNHRQRIPLAVGQQIRSQFVSFPLRAFSHRRVGKPSDGRIPVGNGKVAVTKRGHQDRTTLIEKLPPKSGW